MIVLTVFTRKEDIEQAEQLGVDSYMSKPLVEDLPLAPLDVDITNSTKPDSVMFQ